MKKNLLSLSIGAAIAGQIPARAAEQSVRPEPPPPQPQPNAAAVTMTELFDSVAKAAGKTTIAQKVPNGAFFVYVSPQEMDPVAALLRAALSIMTARGMDNCPVKIQRSKIVTDPSREYMWQVMDNAGTVIESGYAPTELAANEACAAVIAKGI